MTSQDLVVRQPPQYGGFEDTQELEWYGSNPEGIDRRTPEAMYPDEILDIVTKEEEDDSDGEWSRPTYSDASRSPSPTSSLHPPPSRKRKASDNDVVAARKGSKRSKPVPVISSEAVSTMLKLPPHTPETRQAVFSLNAPVLWTAEEFYAYWPLVDNLWVCNKPNNAITGKGTQPSYWWCRLYKGETVSETHGQKNKQLRHVPPCGIKLKMVKKFSQSDSSILITVQLSLHLDKKSPCYQHNHERDYVDQVKINSFVMTAAGEAVAKGWQVASIYSNLRGVKWTANLSALEAAGGKHLKLLHVHNAGAEWKKSHPDGRIQGAKDPWEVQWADCLTQLESLEGVRSANIEALRDIDGKIAHATVFAKRCESHPPIFFVYSLTG